MIKNPWRSSQTRKSLKIGGISEMRTLQISLCPRRLILAMLDTRKDLSQPPPEAAFLGGQLENF